MVFGPRVVAPLEPRARPKLVVLDDSKEIYLNLNFMINKNLYKINQNIYKINQSNFSI